MYNLSMAVVVIFMLLSIVSPSLSTHYLLKAENPEDLPVRVVKALGDGVYLVSIERSELRKALLKKGFVLEEDHTLRIQRIPNDPCLGSRWDLSFVKAYNAWDVSTGSNSVYVAILDTGVDYNHPDLKSNIWVNTGENCTNGVDDDGNGYVDDCYGIDTVNNDSDPMDDNGHGTAVAGILGAVGNNGVLTAGINWQVKIIPCKMLDSSGGGSISNEIECLNYILSLKRDKGLNIVAVNASYGDIYSDNQIQKDKIKELAQEGILYITAAGNYGKNNEEVSMNPCNYDLENMICVGSVNDKGERSDFSHYGHTKVKIMAPGDNIKVLRVNSSGSCSALGTESGTSLSTPFVSGAVALLKSADQSLNYRELRRRVLLTAKNYKSLLGEAYTCGVLDLNALLRNDTNTPKVCAGASVLDWGYVAGCASVSKDLVVRNTGAKPVLVTNVYIEGYSGFYLDKDGCSGKTLNSLQECVISVTFPGGGSPRDYLVVEFSDSSLDLRIFLKADGDSCDDDNTFLFVSCAGGGVPKVAFVVLLILVALRMRRS